MPAIWTTPRDWTAGELVTEAIADAQWRDNLEYLKLSPVFDGTPTITGSLTLNAALVSNSATDATSTLTGAIQTDGGVGIAKALWVGGLANIAGAVTLQTTLSVTGVTTLGAQANTRAVVPTANAIYELGGAALLWSSVWAQNGQFAGVMNVGGVLGVVGTTTLGVLNAGATTLASLTVTGTTTLSGAITLPASVTVTTVNATTVNATTVTASGDVTLGDASADVVSVLGTLQLRAYNETRLASTISAGAVTFDVSTGTVFVVTANANATITLSGTPASGRTASMLVVFVGDGTVRTMTWPGSVVWPGGIAPTLTGTLNKRDLVALISDGATWFGVIVGQNY